MEFNKQNKKDTFFTLWNCANTGKIRELNVLLTTRKNKGKPVDINEPDVDFGMTALHYACKKTDFSMVLFLLAQDAVVTSRSPDGRTPLHFAAAYSNREIVLELLAVGADFYATDNYGCIPLDLAKQNVNKRTLSTLQNWTKLVSETALATTTADTMTEIANAIANRANRTRGPGPAATIATIATIASPSCTIAPASAPTVCATDKTPRVSSVRTAPATNIPSVNEEEDHVEEIPEGKGDEEKGVYEGEGEGERENPIPYEYQPPVEQVHAKMSRPLQILSFRLAKRNRCGITQLLVSGVTSVWC